MQACTDRDIIDLKEGVSLPKVTGLSLSEGEENRVLLTWTNPSSISDRINQPFRVLIEVREVLGPMRTNVILSTHLDGAPERFEYTLPDPSKTYHFTVKINGLLRDPDPNYSSNIYSLGETVIYSP